MIHARTCNICEALCGILVEHDGTRVLGIRGNPDDVFSRGHICPKAVALQDLHEDPDRLRQPVRRQGDTWVPISWESAIDEVATRLHETQQRHGRHAVGVYAGNPIAHSYSALLGGLVFQQVLRTRSRFSATSIDGLPHMFASLHMFGHQLLLPVPDIDRTSHMVIVGANPLVSNGSFMTAPGVDKRLKAIQARGGRIVVIDPRRTETAELADEFHFVRPGTDALLLAAFAHTLFDEDLVVDGPWRKYTNGFDDLRLFANRFPPERVADRVGIEATTIRRMAREFAAAPSAVLYSRVGACTQEFGGLTAWLTIAINVVTGNLDRPGGAMFTHPAVDIVSLATRLGQAGHFDVWRSRVSDLPEFGGELPIVALAEEIETPGDRQVRALVTLAGNPVLSVPNGARLAAALVTLDFYVALDPYIGATSRHANIILPPLSPLERDHYGIALHALGVRNVAKYSDRLFAPPEGARDDWDTLLALAERLSALNGVTGKATGAAIGLLRRGGSAKVLDLLLRTGPYGALRSPRGPRLTRARVSEVDGGADLGPLRPSFPERLATSDRRIDLAPTVITDDRDRLEAVLAAPAPADQLLLIGRRNVRSNNSWMHNSERLVRGKPRCTLLMNPVDAEHTGVGGGGLVEVTSRVGTVRVRLELDERMMPGVVSLPHGWGHADKGARLRVANGAGGVSANDLTDDAFVDALTGNAAFNGVPVTVRAVADAAE